MAVPSAASVFESLAAVTRYAGVSVILTEVTILLLRRGTPFPAKSKYVATYGAVSSFPLGVVLARNRVLFGAPYKYKLSCSTPILHI